MRLLVYDIAFNQHRGVFRTLSNLFFPIKLLTAFIDTQIFAGQLLQRACLIVSSRSRTGNLWFPSASCYANHQLRALKEAKKVFFLAKKFPNMWQSFKQFLKQWHNCFFENRKSIIMFKIKMKLILNMMIDFLFSKVQSIQSEVADLQVDPKSIHDKFNVLNCISIF